MLIYLAGPIDFSNDRVWVVRGDVAKAIQARSDIAVYDPTKPFTEAGRAPEQAYRINQCALHEADGVLGLLPPGSPSIGTPMEISEAHQAKKPVAVLGGRGSMQLAGMGVEQFELDEAHLALEWLTLCHNGGGPPKREGDLLKWTGDPDCQPVRHYGGDAGWDLVVSDPVVIRPGEFFDVPCGISVELPEGVWAMITGRSSTLRKRRLLVSTGIIDNGYRGPLYAGVENLGDRIARIERGERLAQLIPFPLLARDLVPWHTDELEQADRGVAGFGSTGL